MAFDEVLAERIREMCPNATEKKMFGGVGWMERGNLVAGVHGDRLIVRCAVDDTAALLKEKGAKPFDLGAGGKPMRGWVLVERKVLAKDTELGRWIDRSRAFAKTLPAK